MEGTQKIFSRVLARQITALFLRVGIPPFVLCFEIALYCCKEHRVAQNGELQSKIFVRFWPTDWSNAPTRVQVACTSVSWSATIRGSAGRMSGCVCRRTNKDQRERRKWSGCEKNYSENVRQRVEWGASREQQFQSPPIVNSSLQATRFSFEPMSKGTRPSQPPSAHSGNRRSNLLTAVRTRLC